jgi:hypothetical protein
MPIPGLDVAGGVGDELFSNLDRWCRRIPLGKFILPAKDDSRLYGAALMSGSSDA